VAGRPYNGIKSDIWALGVILYVMISGKRPFTGSTLAVLYQKILKLDYEIPPYFSAGIFDLIL
jgi:serine/threonine protein kinase